MRNPVFSNSAVFGEPRRTGAPGGATATASSPYGQAQYGAGGQAGMDASQLDRMYDAPSATPADTKRMTYDDVIVRTGGLLAVLVVVAAATWFLVPPAMLGIALWGGLILGLVLGLVNAFKKNPSPVLIVLYAAAEGVFLGALSFLYNSMFEGAVTQAVIGTLSVFAGTLLLYRSGKIRVTPKFTRFLMMALVGYALFSLVNFALMAFGVIGGEFGLRTGPMGIIIGAVAIILAIMSLMVDFEFIKQGVQQGAPARMAWAAAFGLLVTLVWLYTEILRLIAIVNVFSGD